MSEQLNIPSNLTREEKYKALLPQIKALIGGENDIIANYSNISAALKQTFKFFWAGFYIVKKDQLVLGPFQGTIACTRIKYGKGVCGTAWKENRIVVVSDVEQFEGHIACGSASRSEIVIPIHWNNQVIAVLDIDSEHLNHFDETDVKYLGELSKIIEDNIVT